MSEHTRPRGVPPVLAERLFRFLLPAGIVGESIVGDAREEYQTYLMNHGGLSAHIWYWVNLSRISRHFITGRRVQKPPPDPTPSGPSGGGRRVAGSLLRDVRYGVRQMVRNPGFTAAAVLTLALGIGANTAIFSLVNSVLLKQLPFHQPERLVRVYQSGIDGTHQRFAVTPGNFNTWKEQSQSLESLTAYRRIRVTLVGGGDPEMLLGLVAFDGSVFDALMVPALIGRTFTAEAADPSADKVIVLSYSAWQRLFGGDPTVVGGTVDLGGVPHTLVGVMPPEFRFPDDNVDFWVATPFTEPFKSSHASDILGVVARLGSGHSLTAASSEMETIMAQMRREHPRWYSNVRVDIVPVHEQMTGGVSTRLWILMAAVGFVLLIACSNLASLLMARASSRRREIALRGALGASRWRIARQFLTESLVLAALGGAVGLAVGFGFLRLVLVLAGDTLPRLEQVGIDSTVLIFTMVISLVAGLFFGIFPAVQTSRRNAVEVLREGAHGSARRGWVRQGLVVSEIAMALVLLAGSGLLIRSFVRLYSIDPGVRAEGLLTFNIGAPFTSYPNAIDRYNFYQETIRRFESVPGVTSVALISRLPITGRGFGNWFRVDGRAYAAEEKQPSVRTRRVSPNYFETVGIPLVRGRLLGSDDRLDRIVGVVVNETLARRHWPNEEAVGQRVLLGAADSPPLIPPATVVGVVQNVQTSGLGGVEEPVMYIPHVMFPGGSPFSFIVRTAVAPKSVMSAIRGELRAMDASVPINDIRTMDEVIAESVSTQRSSMILLGVFAGVALVMATVGVFGVFSYSVAQRARELGIRMALGADRSSVRRMVVRQALKQALVGIMIGLAGAYALTGVMQSLLFEISPTDPVTFAGVAGLLAAVAGLASYVPAWRATRGNPMNTLRSE